MSLEIDIDQVRAAPARKKSRVFGHVMLIATICIIVIAFFAYPEILLASIVTGFFAIGGYFGFSTENIEPTINDEYALGVSGFGPQNFMAKQCRPDLDFETKFDD